MINCNAPPKISHRILLTATAIFLLAGTEAAVAKGGSNFGDHGGMRSHDSNGAHERMNNHESHRDRDRGDDESKYSRKREDRHQDADKRTAKMKDKEKEGENDKDKDKDKDKTPGTTTATSAPPAPGTAGNNTIHPIVTPSPTSATPGKPISVIENNIHPIISSKPQPVPGNPATPGTAGTNTIHPIINNNPAGGTPPAGGDVTVSNGVTTTVLHGASAGVVVQTLEPGKIIVRSDNGQSVTLRGGSVNVSGATIVSPGRAIERVDHPNGDVTLAIGPGAYPTPTPPPAPPVPGHVTGGPGNGGILGAIGGAIEDAGKAVGRGAVDVISIGSPTPGSPGAGAPNTSTTTQQ